MVPDRFPKPHLCLYSLSHCPVERESEVLQLEHHISLMRTAGDHFVGVFFTLIPPGIHPGLLLGVLPFPCSPLALLASGSTPVLPLQIPHVIFATSCQSCSLSSSRLQSGNPSHQNSGSNSSTSGAAAASLTPQQPQPDFATRNLPVHESERQKRKGNRKKKKKRRRNN